MPLPPIPPIPATPTPYDAFVGAKQAFKTVASALTKNKKNILVIGTATEVSPVPIVQNCSITIDSKAVWDLGEQQIWYYSDNIELKIFGDGILKWSPSSSIRMMDGNGGYFSFNGDVNTGDPNVNSGGIGGLIYVGQSIFDGTNYYTITKITGPDSFLIDPPYLGGSGTVTFNPSPFSLNKFSSYNLNLDGTGSTTDGCSFYITLNKVNMHGFTRVYLPNQRDWGFQDTATTVDFKENIYFSAASPGDNCRGFYRSNGIVDSLTIEGPLNDGSPLIDVSAAQIGSLNFVGNVGQRIICNLGGSVDELNTNDQGAGARWRLYVTADKTRISNANTRPGGFIDTQGFIDCVFENVICDQINSPNGTLIYSNVTETSITNVPTVGNALRTVTQSAGDNSTNFASTAFVQNAISTVSTSLQSYAIGSRPLSTVGAIYINSTVNEVETVVSSGTATPLSDVRVLSILTATPTGATAAGKYIQSTGTPPAGITLNNIFYWSGAAATALYAYDDCPTAVSVGTTAATSTMYFKNGAGGWTSTRNVDYIFAGWSANESIVTSVYDLKPNVTVNGNIPLATGIFTLTAGKTYDLSTGVALNYGSTGDTFFEWVDATTNTPLTGVKRAYLASYYAGLSTNSSLTGYTPNTNQTIKLRTLSSSGSAVINSTHSWVKIVEMGNTSSSSGTGGGLLLSYAIGARPTAVGSTYINSTVGNVIETVTATGVVKPLCAFLTLAKLTATPTGATPAGVYIQDSGTPPAGVALNDVFYWSGSVATLLYAFANCPSSTAIGLTAATAITYQKSTGAWF
ncbi:hypothetical protein UFOVP352_10 [uncultured Caudovirales phage]|uniref:Uncharacterized protein n=3 Tax=uncultured Caudovirales phage TaxID=2100421 RepID=A0A6J5LZ84_9CAUD|nr:hypothetical protein UFOVP352_10 [uncultured Caudovirales phage]